MMQAAGNMRPLSGPASTNDWAIDGAREMDVQNEKLGVGQHSRAIQQP
jgi:hypothetical protein